MKVELFLRLRELKRLLYLVNLILGFFIAPWIRKRKICGFFLSGTKHMLKPQNELVFVIYKVVNFCENPAPFFVVGGHYFEYWF